MKLSAKHLLTGIALLGILVLFYLKTNRIVLAEHQRFDQSLDQLRDLDAALNQDVLKARYRLLEDYDGFPEQINELKRTVGDLAVIPSFISDAGRQMIHQKVDAIAQLLAQKEELLEQFKSQNAVLNNSLRYLPVAGTELVTLASADAPGREVEALLNVLMRQVLVYSLQSSEDQTPEIQRSLGKLDEWRTRHGDSPHDGALVSLAGHANSIIRRKPKVEALTQQVVSIPIGAATEDLLRAYNGQFSAAMRTADLYRIALYLLCALLVVGIGCTIYALHAANAHLERRVAERTHDLSRKNEELQAEIAGRQQAQQQLAQVHQQLLQTSRQAGMAEVATSVLHNVGNVLNSVNVSLGVATDRAGKLKIASLSRLAAMLREHADDLPAFFASHPQGRQLPAFLSQLAEHFAGGQQTVLAELESLLTHFEHINEIIAMQQSHAGAGGMIETFSLDEVIGDALRMNAASLDRHGAQVVRESDAALPPVEADRHKILLILTNLIRNAKHACVDGETADKCITVRAHLNGDGLAKISVSDNGIGIPPENLARIFEHGFTTRKAGHGFGLHSSALAASEMGGALRVQSDGPGHGATFTIELPLTFKNS